jgi:hypothetical protein
LRALRKRVLSISSQEVTFARRGFIERDKAARLHLEQIGLAFLQGYHLALDDGELSALEHRLNTIAAALRGFAYEGAAMGAALLDFFTPWSKDRFEAFLNGPGAPHVYMAHVGLGWALARLPINIERSLKKLDPLLGWLVIDGYGFHEGYFHWKNYIKNLAVPSRLSVYAKRVFDQGLGRSLWFYCGADSNRVVKTIAAFPRSRQPDLWSGAGIACAYAGGVERFELESLSRASGDFRPHLAQGVAFAAKARRRAGNRTLHTEAACEAICRLPASEAAAITDAALENLAASAAEPAYEVWRRRIQSRFTDQY